MKNHEDVRRLLPLAAAGALDAAEERLVREHAAACLECAEELESFRDLAAELGRMPAPAAPAGLASRAALAVRARREAALDSRWESFVTGFLLLFAWSFGLFGWVMIRVFTGGWFALHDPGFVSFGTGLFVITIFTWLTAGVAAVLLGHQRQVERRLS